MFIVQGLPHFIRQYKVILVIFFFLQQETCLAATLVICISIDQDTMHEQSAYLASK